MLRSPRYVRQRTKWGCGPALIFNARAWVGHRESYSKDQKFWKWALQMEPRKGATLRRLGWVLRTTRHVGARVRTVWRPRISEINRHLDSGGAVALAYRFPHADGVMRGHVGLLVGRDEKSYSVVNMMPGPALGRMPRKVLEAGHRIFLRKDRSYTAWMLSRKSLP